MNKKKRRLLIRTTILILLAAAVAYTLYANFTKDERGQIQAGDHAPDFVLTDMDGEKHKLSDYKGQGVFLNFWGTWCKPCEKEMPYMNSQYKEFKDKGVQILAVNVSESEFLVNRFISKHGLEFPVVIDKNGDVLNAYGVDPLPTTFLINPEGKVEKVLTGTMTEEDVKKYMGSIQP
ncbi:thiol-disulfide oxidoreductase ResA [Rossellomorea aquimaris]|uniref:Thiol-disulfide oxidoreductase n=1 Tax=Rossellomorea aquimaris TaxID=189382 RepID=A0A1J6WH39_9BACI|nr:thiol-disulfide oxidoreductase ResA [Rossellomorea aquimaris]OIU71184.1 thiol-disulfide oxidoreductase [Rossellomorea aquimaris]